MLAENLAEKTFPLKPSSSTNPCQSCAQEQRDSKSVQFWTEISPLILLNSRLGGGDAEQ